MKKVFVAGVVSALTLVSTINAQSFPTETIRIIVPFTAGGSNDVVAREIANGLQASFNQTVVVENKPGGGGTIAYSYVKKSPPDGHVLLMAPATAGPHLSRNPLYNPITDFAPINLVAEVPFVMVVPASLPVRTVKEFVELAKNSPTSTLHEWHAARRGISAANCSRCMWVYDSVFAAQAVPDLLRAHRHVHRSDQFASTADPGR